MSERNVSDTRQQRTLTTRRGFVRLALVAGALGLLPLPWRRAGAAALPAEQEGAADAGLEQTLAAALDTSDLVYLTPLRSDGEESRCHAEVWFVHVDGAVFVVTASDAWRAEAVRRGLERARIWVGDLGVWTRIGDRYRALPALEASAALVSDAAERERVLEACGSKYRLSWLVWGPRFRNGLADGTRVMLRYRPLAA
ncbi:MAG: hypothetical protein R3E86_04905 [Pseudomonadales bacterium]